MENKFIDKIYSRFVVPRKSNIIYRQYLSFKDLYFRLYEYLIAKGISRNITKNLNKDLLTVVVVSAGRKQYLKKTLRSLKEKLIYDKKKILWYIIDDCPEDKETRDYIKSLNFDLVLFNKKNRGIGYSLNKIYQNVRTKYVFLCEDDWEFLRPIPIKKMMQLLEKDSSLGQIVLGWELYWKFNLKGNKDYAIFADCFSRNPNLLKQEVFVKNFPVPFKNSETEYTKKVRDSGFKTGVLGYKKKEVFVRHLGLLRKVVKY